MYENIYGKTSPRFGENAVTLPVDVDRPCFNYTDTRCGAEVNKITP